MRRFLILAMILPLFVAADFTASPAQAYGETVHLVQAGDTLFSVAQISIPDAQWLFNWAPLGTRVVSHY